MEQNGICHATLSVILCYNSKTVAGSNVSDF